MSLESANFISQLVATNPVGTDDRSTIDDHNRLIKSVLQGQFPNFTAIAMNASCVELNLLVGLTATSAELNIMDGVTATTAEINQLDGIIAGTVLTTGNEGSGNGIDADTVDGNEATALLARANHTGTQVMSTISDAGALATLDTVDTAQIDNDAVTGNKIQTTPSTTTGSQTIFNGGSWVIPIGVHLFSFSSAGNTGLEILVSGTWRRSITGLSGMVFSDGTNMRIANDTGGNLTAYYHTFAT